MCGIVFKNEVPAHMAESFKGYTSNALKMSSYETTPLKFKKATD